MEKLKSQSYLSLSWLAPDGTSRVENLLIEAIKHSSTCFFFPSQEKAQAFQTFYNQLSIHRDSCSPGYEKTHRRKTFCHIRHSILFILLSSQVGGSFSRLSGLQLTCSSLYVSIFFIPSLIPGHLRLLFSPSAVNRSLFSCQAGVLPAFFMLRRSVSFSSHLKVLEGSYRDIWALGLPEVRYLNSLYSIFCFFCLL